MIVAIVIVSSLGIAVYTTFAQGVRLWTRTSKDRGEWKIDLWGEKVIGDLRNSFWDPRCPFKGSRSKFVFATLTHATKGELQAGSPVYYQHIFDPRAGVVLSQMNTFENVLMSRPMPETSESILDKVVSFDLQYYGYDPKVKVYRWESQWNKDCFPEAVKITIEPEEASHRKWIRVIRLPTGGVCSA